MSTQQDKEDLFVSVLELIGIVDEDIKNMTKEREELDRQMSSKFYLHKNLDRLWAKYDGFISYAGEFKDYLENELLKHNKDIKKRLAKDIRNSNKSGTV